MRTAPSSLIVAALTFFAWTGARAQEPKPAKDAPKKAEKGEKAEAGKADPSGTWTWTMTTPNGQSFERKVTLKLAGDKLTGTSSGRGGETPIEEGAFKNGEVSFTLTREREGQKFVSKFKGKVEGDTIKGTTVMNRGDGERSMPWEAKRAK
jgi:hypothetical protein